ncbi:DUF3558 family protein [Saccharomonospora sp. NPDC006951]
MRQRILTAAVSVFASALMVAGCSTTTSGTAFKAGEAPQDGGPAAEESGPGPAPDPRDAQAVDEALRQLDPCLLFDMDVAEKRIGEPGTTATPRGPHACMLTPAGEYEPGGEPLNVQVGAPVDHMTRYTGKPVDIGGVTGYELRDYGESRNHCILTIPVSFSRGIEFDYSFADSDTCPIVAEYATAAVKKLQDPDTLKLDQQSRPFSQWDGCTFLRTLLGDESEQYRFAPNRGYDPFASCETFPSDPSDYSQTPVLSVRYNTVGDSPLGDPTDIAGKTVFVYQQSSGCKATWAQTDSQTGNEHLKDLEFELEAGDCDAASSLAEKAIGLVDQAPPPNDNVQRPLLYGPDERDTGEKGACEHFGAPNNREECAPYEDDVTVPQGKQAIIDASGEDNRVQCAVFRDAIREIYGEEFEPLTFGAHCIFVEETHSVAVTVNVSPAYPAGDYGTDESLYTGRQETEFGGKQAVSFYDSGKTSYDIYLSPDNDVSAHGHVHIGVELLPERGVLAGERKSDPEMLAKADEVMTKVVEQYFAS